jgi:hypothetical protein
VATEYGYLVDLTRRKAVANPNRQIPRPEFAKRSLDEKKNDRAAYERIVARFRNGPDRSDNRSDLASALDWIERSKSWGASPATPIVASPDGAYAIFTTSDKPVLLIDVATLATRRLVDNGGRYRGTPAAWSADSRFVAFTPPESKKLYVYEVERQAIVSTRTGVASSVETLAWSPDGRYIAVLGMENRWMDINPFALLAAVAGHPIFRNDAVLSAFGAVGEGPFSVTLRRGISETDSPSFRIEWK